MPASLKFQSLLEQYALLSFEKRDRLDLMLVDQTHEIDLDAGVIRFNDGSEFPVQVLGTQSDNTQTWLWAWAEEQTEIPHRLLSSAYDLRDWGTRESIPEFTLPSIDLDRADGQAIALIGAHLCRADSFYLDWYEGGVAVLLVFDPRVDRQPPFDRNRLFIRFRDLIERYDMDHRNVLLSYFEAAGLSPDTRETMVACRLANGERVVAEFDDRGHLLSGYDAP